MFGKQCTKVYHVGHWQAVSLTKHSRRLLDPYIIYLVSDQIRNLLLKDGSFHDLIVTQITRLNDTYVIFYTKVHHVTHYDTPWNGMCRISISPSRVTDGWQCQPNHIKNIMAHKLFLYGAEKYFSKPLARYKYFLDGSGIWKYFFRAPELETFRIFKLQLWILYHTNIKLGSFQN